MVPSESLPSRDEIEGQSEDEVERDQLRAFEPVRFAVHRDQDGDEDRGDEGGELEGIEDEGHRLVHENAGKDEDRRHEEGDLETRADGNAETEVHLVSDGDLDGDEVLGDVA